jgi:uncharacterized protein (DUF362 family)
MTQQTVSIVPYEKPLDSVRKAVDLAGGLPKLSASSRVILKPNIVMWTKDVVFPKWGIITTSRVVEDMVVLLKEQGVNDITILEGMVTMRPKDFETPRHAFENLGYGVLKNRYGVKSLNVMERPFEKVAIDEELSLNFNTDIFNCDQIINMPVLKTHSQTVVSLGIKNLKGLIDVPSRKKCHSPDPVKDLHYMVSRLADKMPPMFTLIDGIYTNQRGPTLGGSIKRTDLLIASNDTLSADMVGAKVLGWAPENVPHLAQAAFNHDRPLDLSNIDIQGEKIEAVVTPHKYMFESVQAKDGSWLPAPMAKTGITGVSFRKYDTSLCTYCSSLMSIIGPALFSAWKGEPFDKVEILTGKTMAPTKGMNKTVLVGKCMVKAHKNNPDIKEMIPVKGCPASFQDLGKALATAGIKADPMMFEYAHLGPGLQMEQYKDKPEFDENLFKVTP